MRRILIIEDQPEIRQLIRWTLEEDGYEIRETEEATAGLAMAREFRPDLVLLDVMMPGPIDGLEACRQLKAEASTSKPLVVMLSARAQQADLNMGSSAGADAYLTKPFSPLVLSNTVALLLAPSNAD